jgi:hypothetical protein
MRRLEGMCRLMKTVADQFAETLAAAGVKRIYGIVGDGPGNLHLIYGLYDCHRNRVPAWGSRRDDCAVDLRHPISTKPVAATLRLRNVYGRSKFLKQL